MLNGRLKQLFELFYRDPYLVKKRLIINEKFETLNLKKITFHPLKFRSNASRTFELTNPAQLIDILLIDPLIRTAL